jgi:hypothetical protein
MYSVASVATIATTIAVMAKTSLVFRLKAGIIHFLMRKVASFHVQSCSIATANAKC